ncbi:MAG: nuclear transport factor 2 family protein [Deltaproteobacteria bacterium]|nr:nuclear transport factor 2 family protein [Deltaproteobacteria bacterium]
MSNPAKLTAEDRLDILELYARHARAEEAGDLVRVLETFTEDGALESLRGVFRGRAQLRVLLTGVLELIRGKRHVTFHHVMVAVTEGVRVDADFVLIDPHTTPGVVAVGSYTDLVRREDGAWRFAHRRVTLAARGEVPIRDSEAP